MVNRLKIVLEQPEYSGLLEMSVSELRQPPDQVRFILRQELQRRGLLPKEQNQNERHKTKTESAPATSAN